MVQRQRFEHSLKELHYDIIKMGSKVEESIDKTIIALKTQDYELAQKIIEEDDEIDDLEQAIEKKCLILIARQQPVSKDLRSITTALKIITDMERIGDHSADIAELTIRLHKEKYIKPLIDIPKMAELARKMVNKSIDAYVAQDMNLAQEVCASDDYVDDLFTLIKDELIEIVKKTSENIDQVVDFLLIAKYLERMADHATNIAEWVGYNITGKHEHLASYLHVHEEKNKDKM